VVWGAGFGSVERRHITRPFNRAIAERLNDKGFITIHHTYCDGFRSYSDNRAFLRLGRRPAGSRRAVCLWGASAGALVDLLATQTRVDCVIAEGLTTLLLPPAPGLPDDQRAERERTLARYEQERRK
jgi:hypothetical protein